MGAMGIHTFLEFKLIVFGLPMGILLILVWLSYLTYNEEIVITEIICNGQIQRIRTINHPKPAKVYLVCAICIIAAFLLLMFGL